MRKASLPLTMMILLLVTALAAGAADKQEEQRSVKIAKRGAADVRKRVALVIGNSNYQAAPLKNPANDARVIAATLRRLGFEVDERTDLGYISFNEAVESFGNKLSSGGIGLFYYAGHGMQVGGSNFLIPTDSKINSENEIRYKALDAGLVLAKMEQAKGDVNIAIFDACRDNPFARSFRSGGRGLASIDAPSGTIISYATAPGRTASDGDGDNGLFTAELAKALEAPGLRVEDVFKQVRRAVREKSANAQIPWESSSLEGEFYFTTPAEMTTLQTTPLAEIAKPSAQETVRPGGGLQSFTDPLIGMEMVAVRGDCFNMGDLFDEGNGNEKPVHRVCLSDFGIGRHAVTRGQFGKFVADTGYQTTAERSNGCYAWNGSKWGKELDANWKSPGFPQDDSHPVVCVSWNDADAFAQWLSRKSDRRYRLPTEAEWEFAARSGGKRQKFAGGDDAAAVAWFSANSGGATHPVGKKPANGLGLHDMSGNVWQWLADFFGENYYRETPATNPLGPTTGQHRVLRGGSWSADQQLVRTANRYKANPANRYTDGGFRLAVSPK